MHTQINIEISMQPSLFDQCRTQPILLLDILTEQQIEQIKAFVFDNLEDKDGAPEVDNLGISTFKYKVEEREGSFRLHFYINRRFCCSDTESSRQDYIDFHFRYLDEILQASASYFNWNLM